MRYWNTKLHLSPKNLQSYDFQKNPQKNVGPTRIPLEGTGSFDVLSRFVCYNLYVYCTARSSWLDVGPVLEMNRT